MPVINLPRDTRFGELGAGLGNLIGGVASAYADKQTSNGVAEIMNDPSISEKDKPIQALKKYGHKGYEFYNNFVKTQVLQSQIQENLSQVGLRELQKKAMEAKLPYVAKAAEADINKDVAQTGNIQQQTLRSQTLTPLEAEQEAAKTAQTRAATKTEEQTRDPRTAALLGTAQEKSENIDEQRLKNAQIRAQLGEQGVQTPPMVGRSGEIAPAEEQPATLTAPGTLRKVPEQLGTMLEPYGLATNERKAAEAQYIANERKKPGSGLDAAIDYAAKREATRERVANQPAVPEGTAKIARANASYGLVSERFLNELVKETTQVGLLNATGVKARLARAGLPVADESLSQMLEAQKQLVASQAKEGAVFMSGQTIKLGRDISPSIDRTKLSNVLGMGLTAAKNLAELDIEKQRFAGNPRAESMLDKAGEYWTRVKTITDSVDTRVVKDEKGAERTVMYFMGNQVDPLTLAPKIKQDNTKYKVSRDPQGRTEYTGVDLFNIGRALGKDPWQVYLEMK